MADPICRFQSVLVQKVVKRKMYFVCTDGDIVELRMFVLCTDIVLVLILICLLD